MTIPASELGLPVYELVLPVPDTILPVSEIMLPASEVMLPASELMLPAYDAIVPDFETTISANEIILPAVNVVKNIFNIAKIIVGIIISTCELAITKINFTKIKRGDYKIMTDDEVAEFDSAVRMVDFKNRHADIFADNAKMTSIFAALEADIATLEAAGANRVSSSGLKRDATINKGSAKAALYQLLRKTVNTAKLIKSDEPDFDNTFKIRRGTLSEQEILDYARAFADDLTAPTAAKFSDSGAPSVNAANYNANIAAFETARTQQNTGKSGGVAATAATKAASKRLMQNRRKLALIGTNIIEELDDAALLAEWKSACRVEKRKSPAPQTPPTPTDS